MEDVIRWTGRTLTNAATETQETVRGSRDNSVVLGIGGGETSLIHRTVTTVVELDKAQERRYYRAHSGRYL